MERTDAMLAGSHTRVSRLLDVDFHCFTEDALLDSLVSFIKSGHRGWVCTVNVSILMALRKDNLLRNFVRSAEYVIADGQPIVWLSKFTKNRLPERLTGIDLIDTLTKRAVLENLSIYLLGASEEVVRTVNEKLNEKYPGVKIVGSNDGYFSDSEGKKRAQQVSASGANILFLALGVPRQEKFLHDHWGDLGVNIAIGVGGSFDVLAGKYKRAPRWLQTLGLEWAFRLAQDPRRLFIRYLTTNTQFVWYALLHITSEAAAFFIKNPKKT